MKNRPYLIQRLLAPSTPLPFAFGGGLLNGGINKEAMSIIKNVFSFDYMGAAEFEWGAVPTALAKILELSNAGKMRSALVHSDDKNVFVICPINITAEVIDWILQSMKGKQLNQTKEYVGLYESINGAKYAEQYKGWLKIERDAHCEEPFMFFVDEEMFNNTKKLFGIEQEVEKEI